MGNQVLNEVKEIRRLLSNMLGTADKPEKEIFSSEAIEKFAKEYKDLSIKRGEWIETYYLYKYIKGASYDTGKLIIEKFGFTNYFKMGQKKYFNRKDLLALSRELKDRNINLSKYSELLKDKEKFDQHVKSVRLPKGKNKKKYFNIPEGLKDINSVPYSPPDEQLILNQIDSLMEEFQKDNLSEYIDIFESKTYAIFKYIYAWDRYLDKELKRKCKKWVNDFNYANYALKELEEYKLENH